ncbi:MAG: histidine kinase [Pirellulaceae bacterium]
MIEQSHTPKWLGYELHDGLLQWILAARMELEVSLAKCDDPKMLKRLSRIMRYAELAIEEGRELVGFLEEQTETPPSLATLIREFTKRLQPLAEQNRQSISFCEASPPWPDLAPATQWNLLRIAEQATRNAVQHAGPAEIVVTTDRVDAELRLVISDDGVGSEGLELESECGHFGLSSMRHRATLIGANFQIEGRPGQGCRVEVRFTDSLPGASLPDA